VWPIRWFQDLGQDVRFALRQLRKSAGFTAAAVVTLAVGIGADTAVFSVVRGVVLRPLSYPHPEQLVRLWTRFLPESGYESARFTLSPAEAIDYRRDGRRVQSVAYYRTGSATLTGDGGEPQRLSTVAGSVDLLPLLGVRPLLGRWIQADEDRPGGPRVAVLGHALWVSRFGADTAVVGRAITLNGISTEVVGVMPGSFRFPDGDVDAFLPFQLDEEHPGAKANHYVNALMRLAPGATLAQARAEMEALTSSWRAEYGHPQPGHFIYLTDLRDDVVGDAGRALWTLMAAVALVLVIAAANVAGLVVARSETRTREVSLRVALGAGRARIARQLLTESVLLSAAGAAAGLLLVLGILRGMRLLDPEALPRMDEIALDLPVLAFTTLTALLVALAFGLAPALASARGYAGAALSSGARTPESTRGKRTRSVLVAAEVALGVVVVVSAGVVARSFAALVAVDPGIDPRDRLTFDVSMSRVAYPSGPARARLVEDALDHLRALPGVTSAAFTTSLPLDGGVWLPDFHIQGKPRPAAGTLGWSASTILVSPGYFETMGMRTVRGRTFDAGDRAGSAPVAVVSEETARRFWPGEDPVGALIAFGAERDSLPWMTVVGIVGDTPTGSLDAEPMPQIYASYAQAEAVFGSTGSFGSVILETSLRPGLVVPSARRAMAEVDPDLPLDGLRTVASMVRDATAKPRLTSSLLASFALVALLLAVVGAYGLVSYAVARRRREIGIRMAMGARGGAVVGMMVRQGMTPAIVGAVVGVVVAWAAASLLRGLLFHVSPRDPLTYTLLPPFMVAVAALASWLPARGAARVTPVDALREE
jgi:putative ABC transport system permease protein